MPKLIITHIKPHLDEIMAVWLIRKYFPQMSRAKVEFISAENRHFKDIPVDSDPKVIYIGIGRGKFDEHRGLIANCATTLVWRDIKRNQKIENKNPLEVAAVDRLVEYVLREDTGRLIEMKDRLFSVQNILWGYYDFKKRSSTEMMEFGQIIINCLLAEQLKQVELEKVWKNKVIFQTKWGQGIALKADEKGLSQMAFEKGFALVAVINPRNNYHGFRARTESKIDFSQLYQKVKEIEPQADWFLHQSKRLLLCGGDVAPKAHKSKLNLEDMISLVKN